ncbi:MAG TPA: DUF2142 domain-containing protein, partial [Acidimicrobiales bacterium]
MNLLSPASHPDPGTSPVIPWISRTVLSSRRRVWWTSFAVFAALGAVWALSGPLMSAPDEPAHTIKAVATANGQLTGREVVVRSADPNVVSGTFTYFTETRAIDDLGRKAGCYAFTDAVPAGCLQPILDDDTPAVVNTQIGDYPPVYYALVGWPIRFLRPHYALMAMRLVAVLIAAALFATGLGAAREAERPAGTIAGIALALTP